MAHCLSSAPKQMRLVQPRKTASDVAKSEAVLAPAKINLTLHILGRRVDGFHELESLVAFASFGDRLTFRPGAPLDLKVSGPMADGAGPLTENLVLRAVRELAERIDGLTLGAFALTKRLPSGAGLGGGSADAAAALRLVAKANRLGLGDARIHEAACATGADVPVCLDPQPRVMRGIGEILSAPIALPKLGLVIVHPGLAVPTGPVFKALGLAPGERFAAPSMGTNLGFSGAANSSPPPSEEGSRSGVEGCGTIRPKPPDRPLLLSPIRGEGAAAVRTHIDLAAMSHPFLLATEGRHTAERDGLLAWLASQRNDLEPAAIAIAPPIADVLGVIAGMAGCRFARMSGSGSACFGLFETVRAAEAAGRRLAVARPSWWVRAARLGS